MLIYDYEVFKHDTLLGVLNEETGEVIQIWDIPTIKTLIEKYISNIWIGYNCEHYDKILSHGILSGKLTVPGKVFDCSNAIIRAQDDDTPVFGILGKFGISDYYSSPILSYDVMGDGSFMSLKQNERIHGNGHCGKCCTIRFRQTINGRRKTRC